MHSVTISPIVLISIHIRDLNLVHQLHESLPVCHDHIFVPIYPVDVILQILLLLHNNLIYSIISIIINHVLINISIVFLIVILAIDPMLVVDVHLVISFVSFILMILLISIVVTSPVIELINLVLHLVLLVEEVRILCTFLLLQVDELLLLFYELLEDLSLELELLREVRFS